MKTYIKSMLFFASILYTASNQHAWSQFNDCLGDIPAHFVDLSSDPDNILGLTINLSSGLGECCGLPTNRNCNQVTLLLHPDAVAVSFNFSGAAGSFSIYPAPCESGVFAIGDIICLSGAGPHHFLLCRPGAAAPYNIEVQSYPGPSGTGDIITGEGCNVQLGVIGLVPSTISWTSVTPGAPNEWNNLLSNLPGTVQGVSGSPFNGYEDVLVTPQAGGPSSVTYEVCGTTVAGSVCASVPNNFCTTSTVTIVPELFAFPGPETAICNGTVLGSPITVTAQGGAAPYTYTWTGPGGFNQVNTHGNTTDQVNALLAGTYEVTITDSIGCSTATASVNVIEFTVDIVAMPGDDFAICATPLPILNLNGAVSGTNEGVWSGGAGSFNPDASTLDAIYTPTSDEVSNGSVTLTLTPTNTFGCPFTPNDITITFTEFESVLSLSPTNVSCFGLADGEIDLSVLGGFNVSSILWSTGETSEDINGLIVDTYEVTVTDINGCNGSASIEITQPDILMLDAIGTNVTCFGADDGSITVTNTTGGTLNYAYSLNGGAPQAGGTFTGLAGAVAGIDYTITVIDANGCTDELVIAITQPELLVLEANSTNVTCFDAADGSITVTNTTGGTLNYAYSLNGGAPQAGGTFTGLAGVVAGIDYTIAVIDANGCTDELVITITQPELLVLEANSTNVTCFDAADGSITVTNTTGGTLNYAYSLNGGAPQAGGTFTGLAGTLAGIDYIIAVIDANGCTDELVIAITQPELLVLEANSINVTCFDAADGSITVTNTTGGTPNYAYSLNGGAPQAGGNFTGLAGTLAGIDYIIAVIDANGCTDELVIAITQPDVLDVNPSVTSNYNGFDISCNGSSDGSTTAAVAGGTPAYAYSWTNANGTVVSADQNANNLAAGTYTITITDQNGCVTAQDIVVNEPTTLSSNTSVLTDFNGFGVSCFGDTNGSVNVIVNGGAAGYNYIWTNANNNVIGAAATLNNVGAGIYSVLITDVNGCQITNQVEVTQPPLLGSAAIVTSNYNGQDISCHNATDGAVTVNVNGGTPAFNYVWTNAAGQNIGQNQNLTGIGSGTYSVLVTDANGCQTTATVTVNEPAPLFANLEALTDYFGMPVSCVGQEDGTIQVSYGGGTATYIVVWEEIPGNNTNTASNLGVGQYSVTVFDINGCQISDVIILDAHPLPLFAPGPPVRACFGDLIEIDCFTQPGNSVVWSFSNGMTGTSCQPNPFTANWVGCFDANVVITSPFGCVSQFAYQNYICVDPLPNASFFAQPSNPSFITPTTVFTNLSTGAVSYEWVFGDGSPNAYTTNVQHTFPDAGPGQYIVTLIATSEYGCIDTMSMPIQILDELIFYVPNAFTPDGDDHNNMFNPIFFSGFDPFDYTLLIFNRWGEVIFESRNAQIGWDGTYAGIPVQDGVYIWKIMVGHSNDANRTERIGHVTLLR